MSGRVAGLAVKTGHRQPLEEAETVEIQETGIVGNVGQSDRRRVTLLSREQWEQVQSELSMDLPWTTRRANILVEGMDLGSTLGKTILIGDVQLRVEGETHPCGLMDTYFEGLCQALVPECRGGVHARVLGTGSVSLGDTISVE